MFLCVPRSLQLKEVLAKIEIKSERIYLAQEMARSTADPQNFTVFMVSALSATALRDARSLTPPSRRLPLWPPIVPPACRPVD